MISPFKSKVLVKEFKSLKGRVKYDVDDHDDGDHHHIYVWHIALGPLDVAQFHAVISKKVGTKVGTKASTKVGTKVSTIYKHSNMFCFVLFCFVFQI